MGGGDGCGDWPSGAASGGAPPTGGVVGVRGGGGWPAFAKPAVATGCVGASSPAAAALPCARRGVAGARVGRRRDRERDGDGGIEQNFMTMSCAPCNHIYSRVRAWFFLCYVNVYLIIWVIFIISFQNVLNNIYIYINIIIMK